MSGMYVEPVVGWRAWRVVDGRLYSTVFGTEWPERVPLAATCGLGGRSSPGGLRGMHEAPYRGCECGIYALKSQSTALAIARQIIPPAQAAIGRVSLWGHVVETERGYRAQYAYVYDVHLLDATPDEMSSLRRRYAADAQHFGLV